MTQKEIDCLNKFYSYLCDNRNTISEDELTIALDLYIFYQNNFYNQDKIIFISYAEYEKYKNLRETNANAFAAIHSLINVLLNKRFNEVYNFYKIYKSDESYFRKDVSLYEHIPFKGANIDIEKVIFSKLFSNPLLLIDYRSLISEILFYLKEKIYTDINDKNIESIDSWLYNYRIYFSSFYTDGTDFEQLRINNKRIYGTDEDIRNKFLSNLYNSYAVGNYAELVVFKLQKRYLIASCRPDLAERVKWVARDVGDGFGYDILSFDPKTSKEILIEAKGTVKKHREYAFELTNKEKILFDNSILNPTDDNKYFVYHVYLDNYNLEDIYPVSIVECKKDDNNNLIVVNQCEMEYDVKEDPKNVFVESYKKKYLFKRK